MQNIIRVKISTLSFLGNSSGGQTPPLWILRNQHWIKLYKNELHNNFQKSWSFRLIKQWFKVSRHGNSRQSDTRPSPASNTHQQLEIAAPDARSTCAWQLHHKAWRQQTKWVRIFHKKKSQNSNQTLTRIWLLRPNVHE